MRDSYDDYEYEDELDRMRTRKTRKTQQKSRPVRRDEPEPEYDWDDDYEEDYEDENPDDDWEEFELITEAPQRKPKARRSSGRPAPKTPPRQKARSGKKKSGKKRKSKLLPVILLILLVVCGGIAYSFWNNAGSGYWTVAVFGLDARDGSLGKGALADVQMVCTINRETGEIKLISVFRDTYLQIDSSSDKYYKINQAYHKGGHTQAVSALENNLDLSIDDYASFNWKAVADTINILGGIDLEITDREFAYINSFITETVESTGVPSVHLQHGGMNHLDGVQAVAYARLRLMDTDFKRTERQRRVIALTLEKAKQADFATLNNIITTVLPQLSTSVNAADLIALAKNIDKYYIGETAGFPFAHEEVRMSGQEFVVPATLESNVVQLHQILYGVENYRPSQQLKAINQRIAAETGIGSAGTDTESGKDLNLPSNGSGSNTTPPPTTAAETVAPTEPVVTETEPEETSETETSPPEETTEESSSVPEVVPPPETEPSSESQPEIPTASGGPGMNLEPTAPAPETADGEKPTVPEVGPGVS